MRSFRLATVTAVALLATAAFTGVAATGSSAATPRPHQALRLASMHSAPAHATTRPATAHALRVPDPAAYARQKAAANAVADARQHAASTAPLAPTTFRSFAGIRDSSSAPSDSTGAVGTTRYIELVNSGYAIFNRTSNTPINIGTLLDLMGSTDGFGFDNIFDPQIIWDPGTTRFYYLADDINGDNFLSLGFSKTASPNSAADWCKYNLDYGPSDFPDYPKLGDTKDFMLFGVNVFTGSPFTGSDVLAVTKPAAGTACPAPASFGVTQQTDLQNANGAQAFTPVPANQTDTSGTGWIVARPATIPGAGATFLDVFKVTRDTTTGAAVIQKKATSVPVTAFKVPAAASQKGTTKKIDTSDTRNTQAVSAIDPAHGTSTAVWTQHTVLGGAGAEVRWYEIDPVHHTLFQKGTVTSPTLFTYNGAISPDRLISGATKKFGSDMVMDFNTSSATTFIALKMVSKIGAAAQSAPVQITISTAADTGFDCAGGTCRWGDYAAATPDPAAPTTGSTGQVWGTSMLGASGSTSGSRWTTWNFAAAP